MSGAEAVVSFDKAISCQQIVAYKQVDMEVHPGQPVLVPRGREHRHGETPFHLLAHLADRRRKYDRYLLE